MGIVNGRTEYKTVCRVTFVYPFINYIVIKYTTTFPVTAVAADTVADRLCSYLQNFRFDIFGIDRFRYFGKSGKGTAVYLVGCR